MGVATQPKPPRLVQPTHRWFAENEELPTQASMISVQLIFYFYAS